MIRFTATILAVCIWAANLGLEAANAQWFEAGKSALLILYSAALYLIAQAVERLHAAS